MRTCHYSHGLKTLIAVDERSSFSRERHPLELAGNGGDGLLSHLAVIATWQRRPRTKALSALLCSRQGAERPLALLSMIGPQRPRAGSLVLTRD